MGRLDNYFIDYSADAIVVASSANAGASIDTDIVASFNANIVSSPTANIVASTTDAKIAPRLASLLPSP